MQFLRDLIDLFSPKVMAAQFQRIFCYICNDLVQKDFFRDHIALHIRYIPYLCQFEDCYSLFCSERSIRLHSQQKHNGLNEVKFAYYLYNITLPCLSFVCLQTQIGNILFIYFMSA